MWVCIILFPLICFFVINKKKRRDKKTIIAWYQALELPKHQNNYDEIFQDVDGFYLSRQARRFSDAIEYTYGEIDFVSFIALISLAKPNQETIFYDLGSGTGKAVLAAAMVFQVQKSCGIERFNSLHQAALQQQQNLLKHRNYASLNTELQFIQADFLTISIDDATLVFVNATAFFKDAWYNIERFLTKTKLQTIIITTSKPLTGKEFILLKQTWVQMSWGIVKAFIHQRIA
jgi:SAM-dependent methyltransferase